MQGGAVRLGAWVALPVKALKVGQEDYWLDQIARDREEYFSGRGESPGRFVGTAAADSGLTGIATAEQVRAMFGGQDPATGQQRCKPLWRADPRSKLPAAPLLEALKRRGAERGVVELERLAASKALAGDVRAVQAACRLGGAKRIKVETVERVCRKVLRVDPRSLYGETFDAAWQHRGKRVDARVAAFDLCFSSPKSVSLLAAGGGAVRRQQVNKARATALAAAVRYLEAHGVGVRREHNGAERYQTAGGLLAVAFEHRMSRAGDPQSHVHVLVQNATEGPDARWTALDSDRLFAHLMAADHLYLAVERAELTRRLHVRWGPVDLRSGAAEIVGLDDRGLLQHFSKRSEQIDDWLAEQGLSGIKASSAAAVATRQPKQRGESEEQVYARWERELSDCGITSERFAEACRGGCGWAATQQEVTAVLDELAGPRGLTEQASTFARRDVVDAVVKRLPVAADADQVLAQVEAVCDRFLAERAVPVTRDRRLDERHWSTPELLELERRMLQAATDRQREGCGQVREPIVQAVLGRHRSAGQDQAAMVHDVTRVGDGVAVVVGRAGSGKTWALGLTREAFELDGYRVLGAAPTGIATVSLAEEGFGEVRTVDGLLSDLDRRRLRLDQRTVLVIDEAGMVGTRKLGPLLDHARRAGAKVVLVGDDRQFSSIDVGGGFRGLRLRLGASELTVNRRQTDAWEQRAIDLVREQRVEEAIAAYREHERVQVFESRDDLATALVNDWWQAHRSSEQVVILAHRRTEVDRLNTACQQLRAAHGELGPERLVVADRSFAVGDQVVLGANAIQRLGVANGTTGRVAAIDQARRTLTLRTDGRTPRTVTLPDWYLDGEVRPAQSRRVDLAYARTDMRSQGLTRQRALLSLDGCEDTQGLYVQLSRARQRTDLYLTVGPEPLGPDEERPHPARDPVDADELLARVLGRDGAKRLATDEPTGLSAQALRRLSTRELRAERDRLATERARCPRDRSRELERAAELASADEQARRDAEAALRSAEWLTASYQGLRGLRAPQRAAAARSGLAAANQTLAHAALAASRSAARADELRRAEQERRAWLEAHDAPLRVQERAVARELAWRRRADAHALAAVRPTWLLAALGPLPEDRKGQTAWREAAVAFDGYRRAWGLHDERPAQHARGRGGRPAMTGWQASGPAGRRPAAWLLGPEPPRNLAQRRDWQNALKALHRLEERNRQQPDAHARRASQARDHEREREIG
jgi:conjugative relaxase-like TrwC/TraI family protein